MYVLSVYKGFSLTSFGLTNDSNELSIEDIPVVYSQSLLGAQCTQTEFYEELTSTYLKSKKVKKADAKIINTDFSNLPHTVNSISFINTLFVEGNYIQFNGSFSFAYPINDLVETLESLNSPERINLEATKSIYPFLDKPGAVSETSDDNFVLKHVANVDFDLLHKHPLVVSGGFFKSWDFKSAEDLLFLLDTIKIRNRVTQILVDTENALIHLAALKFDGHEENLFDIGYEKFTPTNLGTVVFADSAVEVIIESEVASPQLINVPINSISMIPLDAESEVRLFVKGSKINTDSLVKGGSVGITIDTREPTLKNYDTEEFRTAKIKTWIPYIKEAASRI